MRFWKFRTNFSLAAVMVLLGAPMLQADPLQLKIFDGTTTKIVADNGSGDLDSTAGVLVVMGGVGSWSVNVSTGLGAPFYGEGHLDLNSINVISGSGGDLEISLTQSGLTLASPAFKLDFGGTLGTGAGSTIQAALYGGNNNVAFDTTNLLGSVGPLGTSAFSGSVGAWGSSVNTYQLTQVIKVHAAAAGGYSGDFEVTPVPEPSSVVLFGSGIAGLAFWSRRKKKL